MLAAYYGGSTLESIGEKYGVTRERVRQIINRAAIFELALSSNLDPSNKVEKKILAQRVSQKLKRIHSKRRSDKDNKDLEELNKKIKLAENAGVFADNFFSIPIYIKAADINERELREHRPDIIENIRNNRRRKWSWYYAQCRMCGTTTNKHKSLGYCEYCYYKSNEWKELNKASYLKNLDHRRESVNRYQKEYLKRPEVKAKNRVKNDLKFFGGNRELAITAQKEQCSRCKMSRVEHFKKFKKDLFVSHKNGDRENNDLANLVVLCRVCFRKDFKS
ncbi:MAG: sigma factor-like helix-turn-helix DNA-binding protein [Candidatus Gracilibacteria bacterium]